MVNIFKSKFIRKLLSKDITPITIYKKYSGEFFILISDEPLLEKLPKPSFYNLRINTIGEELGVAMRRSYPRY